MCPGTSTSPSQSGGPLTKVLWALGPGSDVLALPSHCILTREQKKSLVSHPLIRTLSCQIRAPPMQPHVTLTGYLKVPSPSIVTWGLRTSRYEFGGAHNSAHNGE